MPTNPPPKSRLVGPARQADGQTTTAYEALVAHQCGRCGATIAPGQLFSRHTAPGRTHVSQRTRVPVCTTCQPLQVEEHEHAGGDTDGHV